MSERGQAPGAPSTRTRPSLRARLGTGWVWGDLPFLVAAGWAVYLRTPNIAEGDAVLHLRLGQWILAGGSTAGDPQWTYGPHETWHNTLAFAEVVFAGLYAAFGWGGVSLLIVLCQVAAFLLAWYALALVAPRPATRHSPGPARVASLALLSTVAVAASGMMTVRPQSVSMAVAPLLGVVLLRVATTGHFPRARVLVPLTWLWVCWHGYGLLVGPLLLAAAATHLTAAFLAAAPGTRRRTARLAARRLLRGWRTPVGALAVTLLTPAGLAIWSAAMKVREAASAIITEWQPAPVANHAVVVALLLVVLWVVAALVTALVGAPGARVLGAGTRRALVAEGLLITGLTFGFISTVRTAWLLVPLLTVVTAQRWMRLRFVRGASPREFEHRSRRASTRYLPVGTLAAALVVVAASVPGTGVDAIAVPAQLYVQMADEMAADPGAHRVLVDFNTSSIAQYFLPEGVQVSLDGRTDRYGPDTLSDYVFLMRGDSGWQQTLAEQYPGTTDAVLKDVWKLTQELQDAGWRVVASQPAPPVDGEKTTWLWLVPPG